MTTSCLDMVSEPDAAPSTTTLVNVVTGGVTRVFTWEDDARIEVRNLGGEIMIEANAAGLRTLAATSSRSPRTAHQMAPTSTWKTAMGSKGAPRAWSWKGATANESGLALPGSGYRYSGSDLLRAHA